MVRSGIAAIVLCFVLLLAVGLFAWSAHIGGVNSTVVQLIVAVFVGLAFTPFFFFTLWNSRIVIGANRLQVVRGGASVVVQIPYRNVARTATRRNFLGFGVLGIDVVNRKDPDTFWGYLNRGDRNFPFDVVIYDIYADSSVAIGEQLVGMRCRSRSEDRGRTDR
jgi:hypothetical protein